MKKAVITILGIQNPEYDDKGNVTKITTEGDLVERFWYNSNNDITKYRDANNNETEFYYNNDNLTSEQKIIKDDFMKFWLKVSREKYRTYEGFNHKVVVNNRPKNFLKTLEKTL